MYDYGLITKCLQEMRVPVRVRDDLPYFAALALTKQGYVIYVKDVFRSLSDEAKAAILAHEMAHLFRGDCLRIQSKDVDSKKWNVAADACINETKIEPLLAVEFLLSEMYKRPVRFVFKDRLVADGCLPEDFAYKYASTKEIYDNLSPPKGGGDTDGLEIDDGLSRSDAQVEHAKTIMNARKVKDILKDAGVDQSDSAFKFSKASNRGQYGFEPVKPMEVNQIDALLKALGSSRGKRKRTFRREGRVAYTPRMMPSRNQKVSVYVDISGSMRGVAKVAKAVSLYLGKYDVKWHLFGTKVTDIGSPHQIPTTGLCDGTNFDCIFERAQPDRQIVVITDGECRIEHPERVPSNTVWAVIGKPFGRLPGHVVKVGVREV